MAEGNVQVPYEVPGLYHPEAFIERDFSPIEQIDQIPDNNLDEGIPFTLIRELKGVLYKFRLTIIPVASEEGTNYLRNWDLWGPFLLCLLYVLFIDSQDSFIIFLTSAFLGSSITRFNIRALGGEIAYFQAVSILGYCIFPLFMAVFILEILKIFQIKYMYIRVIAISVTTIWCMLSARAFVVVNVKPDRRFVAIYPICLYYIYLGSHLMFS